MTPKFVSEHNGTPLITLSGINKTYINAAGAFTALKDIDLTFFEGEFAGVIGKSGSGKSTLVNMITGIDRPTAGEVLIDGINIHKLRESKQARWRGLNMGVVFQFFQLLPMLTLLENVLLPMDFCNKYANGERVARAMDLLKLMGLEKDAHKLPGAVSGGQQQSAAIARALANDPPIIVADEPTGNLDARTADFVYDKFEALANQGRTIIMITHDPEIEHRLSRKVLISDGEVIDPLLAHAFSWMPHPVLSGLGAHLQRQFYSPGAALPVGEKDPEKFFLVESGEVRLDDDTGQSIRLTPGGYFCSQSLWDLDRGFTAHVGGEEAKLAVLSGPDWLALVKAVPDAADRLRRETACLMQGKTTVDSKQGGLIR